MLLMATKVGDDNINALLIASRMVQELEILLDTTGSHGFVNVLNS